MLKRALSVRLGEAALIHHCLCKFFLGVNKIRFRLQKYILNYYLSTNYKNIKKTVHERFENSKRC